MSHFNWKSGSDSASVLAALDSCLAIIEFDSKGKVLTANENFCRALGYASRPRLVEAGREVPARNPVARAQAKISRSMGRRGGAVAPVEVWEEF
jgi:PAS domain-containing protein